MLNYMFADELVDDELIKHSFGSILNLHRHSQIKFKMLSKIFHTVDICLPPWYEINISYKKLGHLKAFVEIKRKIRQFGICKNNF